MTGNRSEDKQNPITLADQILHILWNAENVTEKNFTAAAIQVAELNSHAVHPVLLELQGVRRVNYRIQDALTAVRPRINLLAIVASSSVDWATAYFYMSKIPASCRTRIFTSMPEAKTWLRRLSVEAREPTSSANHRS